MLRWFGLSRCRHILIRAWRGSRLAASASPAARFIRSADRCSLLRKPNSRKDAGARHLRHRVQWVLAIDFSGGLVAVARAAWLPVIAALRGL